MLIGMPHRLRQAAFVFGRLRPGILPPVAFLARPTRRIPFAQLALQRRRGGAQRDIGDRALAEDQVTLGQQRNATLLAEKNWDFGRSWIDDRMSIPSKSDRNVVSTTILNFLREDTAVSQLICN
jgi:hypothetical protein